MDDASRAQIERLLLLLSVGICEALERSMLSIETAEHLLYSPATMSVLRDLSFDPMLVDLIHTGTELEDVASLIPDKLGDHVAALKEQALKRLRDLSPYDFNQNKWLIEQLRELHARLKTRDGGVLD